MSDTLHDRPARDRVRRGEAASPRRSRGSEAAVLQAYDRWAPLYDVVFGAVLEPGRRVMARDATALQPQRILEVGVGTGLTLEHYPPAATVVGIDLSADMLRRARHRADAVPERDISLYAMNAERMDFPDNSFDCVTVPYVLSVTPRPERLVQEIRRVCRPDGHILILNHFSGSPFWWLMERAVSPLADRIGFRSDFDFQEHVLAHDWHVEAVKTVNLFGLSKLVALRNRPADLPAG